MQDLSPSSTRWGASRLQYFGLVLAGVCLATPFKVGVVNGTSMAPTLDHGQVYLMDRMHHLHQPVKRGEVMVFRKDGVAYVKRVVAIPGDTIYLLRSVSESGEDQVVNTFQLPRLQRAMNRYSWASIHKLIRRTIPEGHYYVMGDNRNMSVDSRQFGLVRQGEIVGRVLFAPEQKITGETIAGRFVAQPRS